MGRDYTFRVRATDDLGKASTSELSASATVGGVAVPPSAPDMPPVVRPGDGQVSVSLDDSGYPLFNGGSPVLAVRVVTSPGGASCDIPWSAIVGSPYPSSVISGLTNGTPYTFTSFGVNAMGVSGPSAQSMPFSPQPLPAKGAEYVSLATPIRVFDSRTSGGPIASGAPRVVDVQAPEGTVAVAVAYNLTVTAPTTAGHAVVGPAGVVLPTTSTINWFAPGQTFANGYVSEVGTNGDLQLTVRGGTAQLIVDVLGYYVSASPSPGPGPDPGTSPDVLASGAADDPPNGDQIRSVFTPLAPSQRVYDSRAGGGRLGGGQGRTVELGDVVPVGATAVAYTLTEFDTAGTGHLAIGLPGTPKPPTSVLNWFTSGQRIANSTVASVDGQRALRVFAGGGSTGFTIDVLGYFAPEGISPEGLHFTPITPARAYDSRKADAGGALPGGQRRATPASPPGQIPPPGTQAMAFNLTAVDTVDTGHLRLAGGDTGTPPDTSAINWYQSGMRLANGSIADIADDRVTTFARGGPTQYLIDVAGYYH